MFHNLILSLANPNSTEIVDIKNGSVASSSPLNIGRGFHGIGILNVDNEDRVAVFGGMTDGTFTEKIHDSVEVYNQQSQKWEITSIKLAQPNWGFGFLTIKGEEMPTF